jgi:Fe-Mn family superoxide dismutase
MYRLPDLPYPYEALTPHVDGRTMTIHHSKHHAGYVDKLNKALENEPELRTREVEDLLTELDSLPEDVRAAVRDHGGGHANHTLFWSIMSPAGGGAPEGELADRIDDELGGFDTFRKRFGEAAAGRFGSGWAWLTVDGDARLSVTSTPNQDSPLSDGQIPILGLDVWEHAYYLHYQNRRPEYVEAWWNVVSWTHVAQRYEAAVARSAAAEPVPA